MTTIYTATRRFNWQQTELTEWFRRIREGQYQTQVDAVRAILAAAPDVETGKRQSRELKESLPFACYQAQFADGGGKDENITGFTDLVFLDFDAGVPEYKIVDAQPSLVARYLSNSGKHLHVIAQRAPVPANEIEHKLSYMAVADHWAKAVGMQYDDDCISASRPAFTSYDPDIKVNARPQPHFWMLDETIAAPLNHLIEACRDDEWECSEEFWFHLATAFWNQLGPEDGWRFFDAWCSQVNGYDREANKRRWDKGFSGDMTFAVAVKEAKEVGYIPAATAYAQAHSFRYNTRSGRLETQRDASFFDARRIKHYMGWGAWDDGVQAEDWIRIPKIIRPSFDTYYRQCRSIASANRGDAVQDWLNTIESLEPSGESPICDTWLIDVLGAEDSEYIRMVSRKILIGLVLRAYRPGCPMPWFPVLVGRQGIGKSLVLRGLVPTECAMSWVKDDVPFSEETKKQMEQIGTGWIVEFPEGVRGTKAQLEEIKSFITRPEDISRKPYDREVTEKPRDWVGFITTNEKNLPADEQLRRFVVIECEKRMEGYELLAYMTSIRERLFAQAKWLVEQGWDAMIPLEYRDAQEELAQQYAFKDEAMHGAAERATTLCRGNERWFKLYDLMDSVNLPRDMGTQRRFGQALRDIGWAKHEKVKPEGKKQGPWWEKPEDFKPNPETKLDEMTEV